MTFLRCLAYFASGLSVALRILCDGAFLALVLFISLFTTKYCFEYGYEIDPWRGYAYAGFDLLKIALPVYAVRAWCNGHRHGQAAALAGWLVFIFACVLSVNATLSETHREAAAKAAGGTIQAAKLTALLDKRDRLTDQLTALGITKPLTIAVSELQAHRTAWRFESSKGCTEPIKGEYLTYCAKDKTLFTTQSAAQAADQFRAGLDSLETEIAAARTVEAVVGGIPVASLFTWITGGWDAQPAFYSMALELWSAFGVALWWAAVQSPSAPARKGLPKESAPQHAALSAPSVIQGSDPSATRLAETPLTPLKPSQKLKGQTPQKSEGPTEGASPRNTGVLKGVVLPFLKVKTPSVAALSDPSVSEGSDPSVASLLASLPVERGQTLRFGDLRGLYDAACSAQGMTPLPDCKLGPALVLAGFRKGRNSAGQSTYTDRRPSNGSAVA